jgi:hypothetical protein
MNIQPHWAWFLLSPLALVLGLVVFIVVVLSGLKGIEGARQTVPVPGSGIVTLEEAGSVTLYFEQSGASEATVPAGLDIQIVPAGGGAPLVLSDSRVNTNYSIGGVVGRNFAVVNIPAPGRYEVTTSLPDGVHPPRGATVAVSAGVGGQILGTALGGLAALGLGFLAAVIIPIIVAGKRNTSKKQQQAHLYQQQPYPPQ